MRRHLYSGLDKEDPLKVEINLKDLAMQVNKMNHGTHRFLSHLVDARREAFLKRIDLHRARGHHDVAETLIRRGDQLSEMLSKLFEDDDLWP